MSYFPQPNATSFSLFDPFNALQPNLPSSMTSFSQSDAHFMLPTHNDHSEEDDLIKSVPLASTNGAFHAFTPVSTKFVADRSNDIYRATPSHIGITSIFDELKSHPSEGEDDYQPQMIDSKENSEAVLQHFRQTSTPTIRPTIKKKKLGQVSKMTESAPGGKAIEYIECRGPDTVLPTGRAHGDRRYICQGQPIHRATFWRHRKRGCPHVQRSPEGRTPAEIPQTAPMIPFLGMNMLPPMGYFPPPPPAEYSGYDEAQTGHEEADTNIEEEFPVYHPVPKHVVQDRFQVHKTHDSTSDWM